MAQIAVILIDHGSNRSQANAQLENLAPMVAFRVDAPVYHAHMVAAEPTLDQALAHAVAAGADKVIVAPCFLFAGRHGTETLAAMAAAAAEKHPGVSVVVADVLGADTLLADLLVKRIAGHLNSEDTA